MNIKYENETWVIEDEYFITREVHEYTVYNCGTETEEAKEQFSSESFEDCLRWVWRRCNPLHKKVMMAGDITMNKYKIIYECRNGFKGEEIISAVNRPMALEIFEGFECFKNAFKIDCFRVIEEEVEIRRVNHD